MYLWRRQASETWWRDNAEELRTVAGDRLAIIEQAGRRRLQFEVVSSSRVGLLNLAKQFGGRVEKLPRDWLKRFSRGQKTEPVRIGKRLIVLRSQKDREASSFPYNLIIPLGAAFGTGEHATTAMSLRMLEKLTRRWRPGWSIIDLGTGSGILTLAACLLGARRVIGIDNDPVAISTAKENARLNRIRAVQFRVSDVRRWRSPSKSFLRRSGYGDRVDIIIANLFSELLIEILPKLKVARWMILSGILRNQESDVTHALMRHKIDILQVRRRGKWVAILTAVR
jgi:ribosomal protein L11 methyltransferase